jgi:SAM-dependent methyltransferase
MRDLANRIIDHYERHAGAWDADRRIADWSEKPWHDRFIAAVPKDASILDLGCGSGSPVARYMVANGLRVMGIDSSPTLISLCRQRMRDQEWMVQDMRSLQLARRFEGILAWDSFFHLTPDDQRHMFSVFDQHAASSAVLMFNSGPAEGEAVGEYRGDPLYHASLSADEYRALLHDIGFTVMAHVANDWSTGGGRTVWIAKRD